MKDLASEALRISYLMPQFPVATEVFAVSDMLALRDMGHGVVVHTMKPPRRDEEARLKRAEVPTDLVIWRPSLAGIAKWPPLLWRHRAAAGMLAREITRRGRRHPGTVLAALACIPRVLEIVDEVVAGDSDVVHVFWSRHAGLVLAVLRFIGQPAVRTTFVGAYDLVADDFLVDIAINSADCVFTHALTNLPYVKAKAPAGLPVDVVHRGIPLPVLAERAERDGSLWITASALTPAKNVETVLRAFATARGGRPDLRLLICGDGPDRPRLEGLASELACADAVTFAGHIERSSLFEKMQGAAVFLLLSTKASERLPNVVKEALWSGCFVISSNTAGIEELIIDAEIGRIVDPRDPAAVAAAVTAALSECEKAAAKRRSRSRELIAEGFSSTRSMSRYLARWQSLRRR